MMSNIVLHNYAIFVTKIMAQSNYHISFLDLLILFTIPLKDILMFVRPRVSQTFMKHHTSRPFATCHLI